MATLNIPIERSHVAMQEAMQEASLHLPDVGQMRWAPMMVAAAARLLMQMERYPHLFEPEPGPRMIPVDAEQDQGYVLGRRVILTYAPPKPKPGSVWLDEPAPGQVDPQADLVGLLKKTVKGRLRLNDQDGICRFVNEHPFLLDTLLEAVARVQNYIDDSRITIEVFTDPEVSSSQELLVSILSRLEPDEADTALTQFEEDWWLDNLPKTKNKMCITLEFE